MLIILVLLMCSSLEYFKCAYGGEELIFIAYLSKIGWRHRISMLLFGAGDAEKNWLFLGRWSCQVIRNFVTRKSTHNLTALWQLKSKYASSVQTFEDSTRAADGVQLNWYHGT